MIDRGFWLDGLLIPPGIKVTVEHSPFQETVRVRMTRGDEMVLASFHTYDILRARAHSLRPAVQEMIDSLYWDGLPQKALTNE